MNNIKEKLINLVRNDWPLKLISILLAIISWFFICEYVDPQTDLLIDDIQIAVNYEGSAPQQAGLGMMTAIDETVSVRISGSRDTIALLKMDPSKVTAQLDLSQINSVGEKDVPVKINFNGINVINEGQSIKSIKIKFDKNIVKPIPVEAQTFGKIPDGFILEAPVVGVNHINVTGPQAIVDKIVTARVLVKQAEFSKTSVFKECEYTFLDAKNKEISKEFLTTDVANVDVTVSVVKERSVPLTVNLNKAFCEYTIEPKTIKISGSADILDTTNSIPIADIIDVSEQMDDYELTFPIVLPDGIKNVDNIETAKVSIKFKDVQQRTFTVKRFTLQNLPDGTSAKIKEKSLAIKVRGLPADINGLSTEDIKVIVDVRGQALTPGTSQRFNALIEFPDDSKFGAVGKYQLTVVVS